MKQIKSPTRYFVILGRTYADGSEADFKAVNALQDKYAVVPLSAYGKPYTPPPNKVDPNPGFSMTDKPQAVIDAMDTQAYFNMMTRLMGEAAPPAPEDAPMVARMAKIGLVPGKPFDMSKLDPVMQEAMKNVPKVAWAKIAAAQTDSGYLRNGWHIPAAAGSVRHRIIWLVRLWRRSAGLRTSTADAVYPYAMYDSAGRKLSGANKYTVTFAKGQTPPVEGFWSITMYLIDGGWWFNPNPLNRFTVSMRDKPVFNPDGSLTLYFQNESPGKDKEANWLPAPKGDFLLMMRMYWPRSKPPSILPPGSGTWEPPPVVQVDRRGVQSSRS